MADRYIRREWLLETLGEYADINKWNTEVCDPDTILRVLQVVENLVKGAPDIGPRQYANKTLAAKNAALKFQAEHLKAQHRVDDEKYVCFESTGNHMLMGFHKGRVQVEEQVIDWLERMVRDG